MIGGYSNRKEKENEKMKLTNLNKEKLNEFFEVVKQCKGNVYLIAPDMHINLKSNLAHYISFVKLCSASTEEINTIEIIASEREDIDRLINFMLEDM